MMFRRYQEGTSLRKKWLTKIEFYFSGKIRRKDWNYSLSTGSQGEILRIFSRIFWRFTLSVVWDSFSFNSRNFRTRRCFWRFFFCRLVRGIHLPPIWFYKLYWKVEVFSRSRSKARIYPEPLHSLSILIHHQVNHRITNSSLSCRMLIILGKQAIMEAVNLILYLSSIPDGSRMNPLNIVWLNWSKISES